MTVTLTTLLMLLGAVHGLVLSVLLVRSPRNRRAGNLFLAAMLVCYTLPLLKVTLQDLGFFRHYDLWPWSIELLYGLGPSLYLYCKTVTDPRYTLSRRDWLQLLPVVLEVLYYASPLFSRHSVFRFGPMTSPSHGLWMLQQAGAMVSILIYLVLTNRRLWAYGRWVKANWSNTHARTLRWLRTPVISYTVFFALWLALRGIDVLGFADRLGPLVYQPLLVFLSLSTYWIGTQGYLQHQPRVAGFGSDPPADDPVAETLEASEDPTLGRLFSDLEALMAGDKPYLDDDLSLRQLAERLAVNPRLLSKVINRRAQMNFYDYVNGYRIDAFKRRVVEDPPSRTILDLAHDCGFGSKATFNHVFKKQTGMTPSRYKQSVLSAPEAAASPDGTS